MCALVANLPEDAAVWRSAGPDAGWTRADLALAALERRVTLLWATVATALGHKITDTDVTGPFDPPTASTATAGGGDSGTEPKSLREIALWMRGG
ncbi:hypothetical protein SK571_35985 [Lentzea sp. BCCO 10_0798]|uniref:Uncharacterized protein n=1 Tax=Lentzea kristufekii TaxID=3095430 RepID=A0ABU4U2J4_9PSEU|nr:hypothetical protein [Lentzea sp. BCCO 10_0798]MDX8054800.1 hypothetical protein [Lentzea sp. BCCO 10_0798]